MEKGTYWIYAGTVKWSETNNNSTVIKRRKIRWKMEVIQSFHKGDISAALLKGHPGDLTWYEENTGRGDHLIVRNGNSFYFTHDKDARDHYRDLMNPGKTLDERNRFFVLPLKRGQHFCEPEQQERADNSYCWVVDRVQSLNLQKKSRGLNRTCTDNIS